MSRKKKRAGKTPVLMKSEGGVKKARRWGAFSLGPTFFSYLITTLTCFVLSQELRDPLSAAVLWFLLAMPGVSLIYLLLCRFGVQVEITANNYVLERRQPFSYCIKLKNRLPLPVGHVEADISLPAADGIRVLGLRMNTTLAPFGASQVSDELVMYYHGRVQVGVDRVYLYDIFRLFRMRRVFAKRQAVEILPRELDFRTKLGVPSQEYAGQVERSRRGFERSEQTDSRPYRAGDPVKDIHWKLSARSEELIVKEFDRTTGQHFYAVCDYSYQFREPADAKKQVLPATIGRQAATGVAELSQAILQQALELGYDCHSVFRSSADGRTEDLQVTGPEVHRALFRRLTYQTEDPTPYDVTSLALSVSEANSSVVCFVIPHITEDLVKQIQRFTALHTGQFLGRVLLYYVDCSQSILDPEYRDRFLQYQIKLLRRVSHIMQVCCVRENADGSMQYYHPTDIKLED